MYRVNSRYKEIVQNNVQMFKMYKCVVLETKSSDKLFVDVFNLLRLCSVPPEPEVGATPPPPDYGHLLDHPENNVHCDITFFTLLFPRLVQGKGGYAI